MDNFEKFYKDNLPDKNEFFSSLTYTHISEEDYLHAINVWNVFKTNNMGDYHNL